MSHQREVSRAVEQRTEVSHRRKFSSHFRKVGIARDECSHLSSDLPAFRLTFAGEFDKPQTFFLNPSRHNLSCLQTKQIDHGRLSDKRFIIRRV